MEEEEEDAGSEVSDGIPADRKPKKLSILDKISAQTIKQILELLCDESVRERSLFTRYGRLYNKILLFCLVKPDQLAHIAPTQKCLWVLD